MRADNDDGEFGRIQGVKGAEGHATSRKVDAKNGLRNVADYLRGKENSCVTAVSAAPVDGIPSAIPAMTEMGAQLEPIRRWC